MAGDGRGTGSIQPEASARLGTGRNETLTLTGLGQGDHLPRGRFDLVLVIGDQVCQEHHFG